MKFDMLVRKIQTLATIKIETETNVKSQERLVRSPAACRTEGGPVKCWIFPCAGTIVLDMICHWKFALIELNLIEQSYPLAGTLFWRKRASLIQVDLFKT